MELQLRYCMTEPHRRFRRRYRIALVIIATLTVLGQPGFAFTALIWASLLFTATRVLEPMARRIEILADQLFSIALAETRGGTFADEHGLRVREPQPQNIAPLETDEQLIESIHMDMDELLKTANSATRFESVDDDSPQVTLNKEAQPTITYSVEFTTPISI